MSDIYVMQNANGETNSLQAYAVAEEKAFSAKTNALFLSLFVIWLSVLLFFQIQPHLDGIGK
jgi:hypothetical protein